MKMQNCNDLEYWVCRGIWTLTFIGCLALGSVLIWSSSTEPCALTAGLGCEIGHRYPEYRVLDITMLRSDDRKLFTHDSPGQCPGVARLQFFGDRKKAVAVLLWKQEKGEGYLVVGREQGGDRWEVMEVSKLGGSFPPVIWPEPPGEYADWNGTRKMKVKWPAIHLVQYEAWSKLFAWDGSKIVMLQMTD